MTERPENMAADLAYDAAAEWKKRALAAEAKLARVSALPSQWRDQARSVNDGGSPTLLVDCAEELETALGGEL